MRATEFITEYRRDITNQNLGASLLAALTNDASYKASFMKDNLLNNNIDEVYSVFEVADPTNHKEYTEWMIRTYIRQQGKYKIEDVVSTLSDAIHMFDVMKKYRQISGPSSDINRFKTPEQLLSFVEDNYEEPKTVDKGESITVFDNSLVRIIVPKDEAASKYYGQGTRWCTAARNENQFEEYNSKGNLFIILPKSPIYPGEKYQYFDGAKGYITDAKDDELGDEQKEELQNRLKLYEYFSNSDSVRARSDMLSLSPTEISTKKRKIESYIIKNGYKIKGTGVYIMIPESLTGKFLNEFKYFDSENDIDYSDPLMRYWILIDIKNFSNGYFSIKQVKKPGFFGMVPDFNFYNISLPSGMEDAIRKIVKSEDRYDVLKDVTVYLKKDDPLFDNKWYQGALINKLSFGPPTTEQGLGIWAKHVSNKLKELGDRNNQVNETSKYLGSTTKVRINKKGMQVPLNKKGFGV